MNSLSSWTFDFKVEFHFSKNSDILSLRGIHLFEYLETCMLYKLTEKEDLSAKLLKDAFGYIITGYINSEKDMLFLLMECGYFYRNDKNSN